MQPHAKPAIKPYTAKDAKTHLGTTVVEQNALNEIFENHGQNCIDGRKNSCAICTPGADAGDFLIKLAATEMLGHLRLTDEQIEELFNGYIDLQGQFNMHSDEHTLHHLSEYLEMSIDKVREQLQNPDDRSPMLDALMNPNHMGCGHLKMMLNESSIPTSQKYPGMRPELMRTFFKLFFTKLWDGDPRLQYMILEGDHEERAVFNIKSTKPLHEKSYVPMIQPKVGPYSAFVIYPDVERFTDAQWLKLAQAKLGLSIDQNTALMTMQTLSQTYLESTANKLAKGLPMFAVPYDPDTGELDIQNMKQV